MSALSPLPVPPKEENGTQHPLTSWAAHVAYLPSSGRTLAAAAQLVLAVLVSCRCFAV